MASATTTAMPDLRLSSQPQSVTVLGRYPFLLLGEYRIDCTYAGLCACERLTVDSLRDGEITGDRTGHL